MKIIKCCWFLDNTLGSWPCTATSLKDLPLLMRRRLTPLGRKALQIVSTCASGLDSKFIPWVVSCRHGDTRRRLNLLSNLAEGKELSPTDFSMSVHNAIISMFSIAEDNNQIHSALAGGLNSFEMGLLESIALIKEKGGTVGYLYYDHLGVEKLTGEWNDDEQIECFAIILSEDSGEVTLVYNIIHEHINSTQNFNLKEFAGFLSNAEKRYTIPIGGGEILVERI